MIRRDAILALLALTAPLKSFAQKPGKVWRIGVVVPTDGGSKPADSTTHSAAFVGEMQAAGYAFGVDYVVEMVAISGDDERQPTLASELSRLNVDMILAVTPFAVRAAHKASKTIPVVCIGAHDPVGLGYAASLARPGGNLTGLATFYGDLIPKHLELIKALAPRLSRVALLANTGVVHDPKLDQRIQEAATKLGMRLQIVSVGAADQLPRAFATMTREHAGAFIAVADSIFYNARQQIADLALKHHLPSLFPNRENVQAGGLVSYGEDFVEMFAQAAKYVSRIMKGAKAGDLPIEQPTKFHLTINRKTAAALKLTIPQELLLRADEVIG